MPGSGRIHDRAILDALEVLDPTPFNGTVWRVTRKGREPVRGAAADGRWGASGEFEVLYTSLEREGALAEIGYRLSLEPVWPSRIEHEIHVFQAALNVEAHIVEVTLPNSGRVTLHDRLSPKHSENHMQGGQWDSSLFAKRVDLAH